MRKPVLALAAALAAGGVPAAMAQQSSSPLANVPIIGQIIGEVAPDTFVEMVASGDIFEIESSRMALQRSSHPQIRAFAEQMIEHHTMLSNELRALPEGATRMSGSMTERHTQRLMRLSEQQGEMFDRWYVQMQIEVHEEAANLYQGYAENGDVPALRSFAQRHLPMIQSHLQQARALQAAPAG